MVRTLAQVSQLANSQPGVDVYSGQYPTNAAHSLYDWLVGHVPPLLRQSSMLASD